MGRSSAAELDPLVEPPTYRWLGLAGGLLVVAALGLVDYHWAPERIVIATVLLGPFIAGLTAPAVHTGVVGAAAVIVTAASAGWQDNFGEEAYWLRLGVVAAGSVVAVVAAESRLRAAESRRRFALLAAVSEVADGTGTLEQTAGALSGLIVPTFADICILDVTRMDRLERISVRAVGPDAGAVEDWLRRRAPMPGDVELGSQHTMQAGRAQLIARVAPAQLAQLATDEEDARRLAALRTRSSMTVPLRTRGRVVGALSMSVTEHSGRRYGPGDAAFAEVLAGRAALALDNAGLFAELETMEAQLSAALGSLNDTVTIQDRAGRIVYANEAAARDLGFTSARELLATPPEQIARAYDVFTEAGEPFPLDQLPGRRVLVGEEPPPQVLRSVHRESGAERWTVTKATAVRGRDGRARLAVNVVEDITEIKRAELAQRVLTRASEALSSSLDYERTLQQLADLAVPELADWCAVSLPDHHGRLAQVAVAHPDPEKVRLARELAARYPTRLDDPGGSAEVLRTGTPQVVNDIDADMLRSGSQDEQHHELLSQLGMRAAMIVPLLVGGNAIGTLALVSAESGRAFGEADVELAAELGRRAGTAVDNARLYTERSAIAATLSESLLPRPLPEMPGWRTATLYRPAGAANLVGGDFYDAVAVRDGWFVVVGDVAGRGAPAARLTAFARHTLFALAQVLDDPIEAVSRLNAELYVRGTAALCTLACAVLRGDRATILCAGHPQPFLVGAGAATQVGEFGPMVGAFAEPQWSPVDVAVAPGDLLVLYTDGVIDTVGARDRFGEERLRTTLQSAVSAQGAVSTLDEALQAFERGEQADDTAVLALERAR